MVSVFFMCIFLLSIRVIHQMFFFSSSASGSELGEIGNEITMYVHCLVGILLPSDLSTMGMWNGENVTGV